jgi:hypothetical protein
VIAEANDALRAKGYSEAQLVAVASTLPGKALLRGNRIVSPFSDSERTVARVAREAVPPFAELGTRRLTPHELRDWLAANA